MRKFDKQKFKTKNEYLEKNVYHGLINLNTGFDAPSIFYFSESDFEKILNRVEKLGLGIYGVEVWANKHYYDVRLFDEYSEKPTDPNWYQKAYQELKNQGDKKLQYSASYYIPNIDD